MKKRILLFTAIAGMAILTLTSGQTGAGAESGFNCTGAETGLTNKAGCSNGTCHSTSATAGITVKLELDSAGSAITHYVGGVTYTVKITGTNTTSNNLPKFGFQVTCIKGTTAAVTPDSAGKFSETGLPTNVRYTSPRPTTDFVCPLIEHSTPIPATSGTGTSGTTYVESFSWTAPVAGTGTISFWGALNAVNGDGNASAADLWNTTSLAIREWTPSLLSVANESDNISIKAFPNPVVNSLNLQMDNAQAGNYSIMVTDVAGRTVANENVAVNGTSQTTSINTSKWTPGMYTVAIGKDGNRKVITVVK